MQRNHLAPRDVEADAIEDTRGAVANGQRLDREICSHRYSVRIGNDGPKREATANRATCMYIALQQDGGPGPRGAAMTLL